MAQTVADVIKTLSAMNPDEPIMFLYWTGSEVGDDQSNGFTATEAHQAQIIENFTIGDYTWEQINEDWQDAVHSVIGEFRCEDCWEYHYGSKSIDGEVTCPTCGEESDVVYDGDTVPTSD